MTTMIRLHELLKQDGVEPNLRQLIRHISIACKEITHKLGQGDLAGILGSSVTENVQGETQKYLDILSNELLKTVILSDSSVRGIGSEEEDYTVAGTDFGDYLVTFDPLDGSSNIDVNLSVGTIFSIIKVADDEKRTGDDQTVFLQDGRKQVAAGYVLYGPSAMMVLTTGNGVNFLTLDRHIGEYVLTREKVMIPEETSEFAINMSNQRFWEPGMKQYIDDCLAGETGPLGKRYNMRWVASMVAEVHRILVRGGIFMYPWDSREPEKPGKLRLMYEGNPMSMLVEQAGGLSTTGREHIMDVQPTDIHQRVPVMLGSKKEVERAMQYLKD